MEQVRRRGGAQTPAPAAPQAGRGAGIRHGDLQPAPGDDAAHSVRHEHKVALIVGGAGEFGGPLAVAFAERGMDVAIIFFRRRVQQAEAIRMRVERLGRRCLLIQDNERDRQKSRAFARRAVERVVQELGRLDVFISLARPSAEPDPLQKGAPGAAAQLSGLIPNVAVMKAALDRMVD